jgi:hypothetical protein
MARCAVPGRLSGAARRSRLEAPFNDLTKFSIFPRYIAPDFLKYLCERINKPTKQNRGTTMKTKLTESKFKCAPGVARQLFSRIACLGAAILICSSASAQNLFVLGNARLKNCRPPCGVIYKFSWDGGQSIFAVGLNTPGDLAFDNAGNLFVVDYDRGGLVGDAVVYKITPTECEPRLPPD